MNPMRAALAAIVAVSVPAPALAEHWVPLWQDYKLDTDSIHTDADGITHYQTRLFPANGGEPGSLKDRAADCAHRLLYMVAHGDWFDRNIVTTESELTPLTQAQLDAVCALVRK